MLKEFITQVDLAISLWQQNIYLVLTIIGILFLIHFINFLIHHRLILLGIYPRNIFTLGGIFLYPFIHGNFNHLFFNAIPLFLLSGFVLLQGTQTFIWVSLIVIVVSGIGIWIAARPGFHAGASGVIMGYWSYLISLAYTQGASVFTVAPLFVCVYYFGGFILQVFPSNMKSSWEAHLFGLMGGIMAAFITPILLNH